MTTGFSCPRSSYARCGSFARDFFITNFHLSRFFQRPKSRCISRSASQKPVFCWWLIDYCRLKDSASMTLGFHAQSWSHENGPSTNSRPTIPHGFNNNLYHPPQSHRLYTPTNHVVSLCLITRVALTNPVGRSLFNKPYQESQPFSQHSPQCFLAGT